MKSMEISDGDLVTRSLGGRADAFEELVRRHQDSVYGFSRHFCQNSADAKDLAQETFIRAYTRLDTYKQGFSFRNWILQICSNLAKNTYRQNRRRESLHDSFSAVTPGQSEDGGLERLELTQALKSVPAKLRTPLLLRHAEGLSYEEISSIMGIGLSAAKMRVKRGREIFVNLFRPGYGG